MLFVIPGRSSRKCVWRERTIFSSTFITRDILIRRCVSLPMRTWIPWTSMSGIISPSITMARETTGAQCSIAGTRRLHVRSMWPPTRKGMYIASSVPLISASASLTRLPRRSTSAISLTPRAAITTTSVRHSIISPVSMSLRENLPRRRNTYARRWLPIRLLPIWRAGRLSSVPPRRCTKPWGTPSSPSLMPAKRLLLSVRERTAPGLAYASPRSPMPNWR